MSYQYPKTTELIERDEEIARLEHENGKLREALEAFLDDYGQDGCYCTSIIGSGKCAICMGNAALASPAPAYVQAEPAKEAQPE